jgi:hypothetical protein
LLWKTWSATNEPQPAASRSVQFNSNPKVMAIESSNTVFPLLGGNFLYVSFERVYDPKLRDRPVVVQSNNDDVSWPDRTKPKPWASPWVSAWPQFTTAIYLRVCLGTGGLALLVPQVDNAA